MAATSKPLHFVELVLTCGSWQEAQRIVDSLLGQRLIACAEFIPVKSAYELKHKLEQTHEVKLIMQTADHYFDIIEAEVAKLHSYETFVLKSIPISSLSAQAAVWLKEELHG